MSSLPLVLFVFFTSFLQTVIASASTVSSIVQRRAAPSVTVVPAYVKAYSGDTVTVSCSAEGQPPYTLTFYLFNSNGGSRIPATHCTKSINTVQGTAACSVSTNQLHAGEYHIYCANSRGAGSTAKLELGRTMDRLVWMIEPMDLDVMVGTSAAFYCQAESPSKVTYRWIDSIYGMEIMANNYNFTTSVTSNDTAVMVFAPQALVDERVYLCKASNSATSIYSFFLVRTFTNITGVHGPQDLDLTLAYSSGTTGNFSCEFESETPANISWFLENGATVKVPINDSDVNSTYFGYTVSSDVSISPEIVKQLGITKISCEADNGFVTLAMAASVTLSFPAKILTPAASYTVKAGSEFSITCETEGSPTPQTSWTFTDEFDYPTILADVAIETKGSSNILTIQNIRISGTFKCFAINPLGSDSSIFKVTVI
ncbi:hypothetical protein EGW08_020248 [Elysia chlorotica]|uniref:Ig-like domain-containing protein n=1 Tax=Elysia chlorotica TaxID=188477 RepID=A0A433SRV1_ELYCH|nr:hypothetical protein EGW08_020248 [Elysia chlorotica]